MRIKKAVEIIKGYCGKQIKCEKCRFFIAETGLCQLNEFIPVEWELPKKGDA